MTYLRLLGVLSKPKTIRLVIMFCFSLFNFKEFVISACGYAAPSITAHILHSW